jgi:galactose mutarotase-like enzyme
MLHRIENENLIGTITSDGAEIRSLINKNNTKEYIWQIDQKVWGSSSPVLFPAIGKLKSDKIEYLGKSFAMPKHGIVRNNSDFIFTKQKENKCSFELLSSEKTNLQYPFEFSFKVIYELVDNTLVMTYNIQNKDKVDLPFICGGHTAYACQLDAQTQLSDYVIEFPKPLTLKAGTLGKSGLLSDKIRTFPIYNKCLQLSENLFDEDALIFENIDFNWVRLKKKDNQQGIVVKFSGFKNLALWSKPGADYLCIEPWLGLPDRENEPVDITKKSTYKFIKPKDSFSISIETIIE